MMQMFGKLGMLVQKAGLALPKLNIPGVTQTVPAIILPKLGPSAQPKREITLEDFLDFLGKNSRAPKKANHGARPCSSVVRRLKKKGYYKRPSMGGIQDPDELNIRHLHKEDEGGEAKEAAQAAAGDAKPAA